MKKMLKKCLGIASGIVLMSGTISAVLATQVNPTSNVLGDTAALTTGGVCNNCQ